MCLEYDTLSHDELVHLICEQQMELKVSQKEIQRLNKINSFFFDYFWDAPIACLKYNSDGIIDIANKSACNILNIDVDKIKGTVVYDLLQSDRGLLLRDIVNKLTPDNKTYNFYVHHLAEDHVLRAYLWFGIATFDVDGKLIYIISYSYPQKIQDDVVNQLLSVREKAENDALVSRRIMGCMLEMIQKNNTMNVQSILRLINEHYNADASLFLAFHEEISKMCLEEMSLSATSSIYLPSGFLVSTIPEFIDRYKQGITRIGYFGEEELLCDLFSFLVNHKIPYNASMSVPILSNDKLWGVLVIIRQWDEQRWIESELSLAQLFAKATAISLERLSIQRNLEHHQVLSSLALEKSEVYSWQYDIKNDKFFKNEQILKRYGFPVGNLPVFTSKTFCDMIYPDDVPIFSKSLEYSIKNSEEGSAQVRVYTNKPEGNSYEWFEYNFIPIKDKESGVAIEVIGTGTCIEKYKQSEQRLIDLLEAKNQAEESNRMKTAFVAYMSHEIRTPLNAIIGFSELLMETETPDERAEFIQIIHENNRLLLQIVNDILDISRIESGHIEVNYQQMNLKELIVEIKQLARMNLSGKDLTVRLEDGLDDFQTIIDRRSVIQIMTNFINNAIKFTQEGTITLGYRLSKEGNGITYYVRDTGCGISEEDRSRIFQRFVKLDDFVQGTGLGLSISETLVKKLNGCIGVVSELGKGSEFWFTLPFIENAIESSL